MRWLLILLALGSTIEARAEDPTRAEGWGATWLRSGLVAVWRWPDDAEASGRPRCVVYLSGAEGWAGERFEVVSRGVATVEVLGTGASVTLSCPDAGSAMLAGHPAPLDAKPVWLIHGIGVPGRGPSVRALSALEADWPRGADVATELYDASSDLRAAIYYTR